jgi:hypothetical protein
MTQELPFKSGDEQDALTGWRRVIRFRPGERKRIKNTYVRRVRRWVKRMLRREAREET